MADSATYPTLVKTAMAAADTYKGTTDGYETVMAALLALDDAIHQTDITVPLIVADIAAERERRFMAQHGGPAITINDLLARGDQAAQVFMRQLLAGDKGAQLNAELVKITIVETPANSPRVFLPPEPQEPPMAGNGETEWHEPEFHDRLQQLLIFLNGKTLNGVQVHWDDLIIYKGTVDPKQMRAAPYHIIDIIPWNMQIAVCDQVGNALFIVPQRLSIWEWTQYGKEALVEKLDAVRIVIGRDWYVKLNEVLNNFSAGQLLPGKVSHKEINEKRMQFEKPTLTEDLIWDLALDYMSNCETEKKHWPLLNEYAQGTNLKWNSLSSYLNTGARGLPGGTSLPKLIVDKTRSAGEDFKSANGRYPNFTDGLIYNHHKMTWADFEQAFLNNRTFSQSLEQLFHGSRLLDEDQIWLDVVSFIRDCSIGQKRLPNLFSGEVKGRPNMTWHIYHDNLEAGNRGLKQQKSLPIFIREKIKTTAKDFCDKNNRYPSSADGQFGDHVGVTWADVEQALLNQVSNRISLEQLFGKGRTLSEDEIWQNILNHLQQNHMWPTQNSGNVFGMVGETWVNWNTNLKQGLRGLQKGSSVAQLIQEKILIELKLFFTNHHRLPNFLDDFGTTGLKWSAVYRACFGRNVNSRAAARYRAVFASIDSKFKMPSGKERIDFVI